VYLPWVELSGYCGMESIIDDDRCGLESGMLTPSTPRGPRGDGSMCVGMGLKPAMDEASFTGPHGGGV